jgi:hypothetical protein
MAFCGWRGLVAPWELLQKGDDDVGDGDDDGDLAYDGVGWVMELESAEQEGPCQRVLRCLCFFLAWS